MKTKVEHTRSEATHSPTPWKVSGVVVPSIRDPLFSHTSIVSGGKRVARVAGIGDDETKANAAFIVKAVNSHEALVSALKNFIDWANIQPGGSMLAIQVNEQAKAALKAAGE